MHSKFSYEKLFNRLMILLLNRGYEQIFYLMQFNVLFLMFKINVFLHIFSNFVNLNVD